MTATAKVFGTPDQEKVVVIEFDYYPVKKWLSNDCNYFINFCEVTTPLEFNPTDLKMDLEIALAEHFGADPNDVKIECEISVNVLTPVLV